MVAIVGVAEQKIALRIGRSDWAALVHDRAASWIGGSGELLFLLARWHAYHGHSATARTQLNKITSGQVRCLVTNTEIETHLLVASLAQRTGDRQNARVQLIAALVCVLSCWR